MSPKRRAMLHPVYFAALLASIVMSVTSDDTLKQAPPSQNHSKRPNIVFVMADDLGYNDIGYHNPDIISPFLDELSKEGIRLENYYVQPVCTPTRSQFMSGRYQIHTGLQHKIIQPGQPNGLPLDSLTLADKLLEAGYSTHLVGKWHLGFHKHDYVPTRRGFETFFGLYTGSSDHYTYVKCPSRECGQDLHNDTYDSFKSVEVDKTKPNQWYSTHLFTRKAIEIIENQPKEKPLFLYLSYTAVHGPIQVPQRYVRMYTRNSRTNPRFRRQAGRWRKRRGNRNKKKRRQGRRNRKQAERKSTHLTPIRRNFAGMVTALDEGVGRVVQALKDQGMWNNTILVFSTDNGAARKLGGSNFPLRGGKGSMFEGGVRAVGFVASPLLKKAGYTNTEMMHITDWFPTFIELAKGNFNGTKDLAGFNLWPTLRDGQPSPRAMILHNIDPLTKLQARYPMFNDTFDTRIEAGIRIGDYKLLTGLWGKSQIALYNIRDDPTEARDLSHLGGFKVRRMLGALLEYHNNAVPPYFPKRNRNKGPVRTGRWEPWL